MNSCGHPVRLVKSKESPVKFPTSRSCSQFVFSDAVNPPTGSGTPFSATKVALEIKVEYSSIRGANTVPMFSHIPFTAAVAAIAMFFPAFQNFGDRKFLFSPEKLMRQAGFAAGHVCGIKAGVDRSDRTR